MLANDWEFIRCAHCMGDWDLMESYEDCRILCEACIAIEREEDEAKGE